MTEQWLMRPDGDGTDRWWIDLTPDPDIQGQTIGPPVANVFTEKRARLIAAAPDLLAALENMLSQFKHVAHYEDDFNVLDQTHAAIAKARKQE